MIKNSKLFKVIALVLALTMTVSLPDFAGAKKVDAKEAASTIYKEGTQSPLPDATTQMETTEEQTTEVVTTEAETTTEVPTTEVATTTAPIKDIVPSAISGLKVTSVKTNQISLKWNAGKNATEYRIYRSSEKSNGKMTKSKRIKTQKGKTFTDKGLTQSTKYTYSIYSYRLTEGKATHSKAVSITVLTKPEAVANVSATKVSAKSVTIKWKKNKKVNKYVVYRATEKASGKLGKYSLIKTLGKSKTTFTDKKVTGAKAYRYKVAAKRTSKKGAVESGGKTVTVVTPVPSPSKLKKKKAKNNRVTLSWKKVKGADAYEVYKDGKLVGTTKKTTYKSKKLKLGVTYQFSVKAVKKFNKKKYKSGTASLDISAKDLIKGTWIEVSIKKQTLYMYVKNKLYVKTPVVTGNVGDRHTSKGKHYIMDKSSPSRLVGSYKSQKWDVKVNYWMRFTSDGQGIHDSTWRSAYGGNIYKTDGSHGCVNTPLAAMKKIYKKAKVGTLVYIH